MKSPLKTNPRHGQAIKITRRSHGPTDRDRSHLDAKINLTKISSGCATERVQHQPDMICATNI